MNASNNNCFSLLSALAALTVIAIGLALLTNFGPLSALVASLAIFAFAAVCCRYFADWRLHSIRKKTLAVVMTTICGFFVFIVSAGFWMQTEVQSNRLTTIYRSKSGTPDLNVSVFRGKVTSVTVSGSFPSRESFDELRDEIFADFSDDPYLQIHWNVTTNDEKIQGSDRDLFAGDYDSTNRGVTGR